MDCKQSAHDNDDAYDNHHNNHTPYLSVIAKNMTSTGSPLAHVCKSEWTCRVPWLMNEHAFHEHFEVSNRVCIAQGGQGKIYSYQPKNVPHANVKTIVKQIKLRFGEREIQQIWKEFVLIKESKLLYYGSMFYDRRQQQVMITSEPLHYTLKQMVSSKYRHCKLKKKQDQKPRVSASDASDSSKSSSSTLKMTEYETKLIVLEILDKLYTLHKCGYYHLDLKPSNIMKRNIKHSVHGDDKEKLISNGWKIIDFGAILAAKNCRRKVAANGDKLVFKYRGTISWSAPEIGINSVANAFSIACDIWSLGLIVLYTLLGEQPYQLNLYEHNRVCRNKLERKEFFYFHKLLQFSNKATRDRNAYFNAQNEAICNETYVATPKDFENGQIYMSNYLIKLYYENKISLPLFDLLQNYMLQFDPKKRRDCPAIYAHEWFDDVRDL